MANLYSRSNGEYMESKEPLYHFEVKIWKLIRCVITACKLVSYACAGKWSDGRLTSTAVRFANIAIKEM